MFGLERFTTVSALVRGLNVIFKRLHDKDSSIEKSIEGNLVLVGTPSLWLLDTPPKGYLLCDGRAISRKEYSALFEVIGTKFGAGDGVNTFNLPDPSGLVPRFVGSQSLNGRLKQGPLTVGEKQEDQMQRVVGNTQTTELRGGANNPPTSSGMLTLTDKGDYSYSGYSNSGNSWRATMELDSANSPDARTSSTTDGETRVSSIGFNLIIKY